MTGDAETSAQGVVAAGTTVKAIPAAETDSLRQSVGSPGGRLPRAGRCPAQLEGGLREPGEASRAAAGLPAQPGELTEEEIVMPRRGLGKKGPSLI